MTFTISPLDSQQVLIDVSNTVLHITPEQFDRLCLDNPDLRLELTKDGKLIAMPPTGGDTGEKNVELSFQVAYWNKKTKLGRVFDSSTGYDFVPIGGGRLSPDVSWIETSRLAGVPTDGFIPVVPDFVIELRSKSDKLKDVQDKMLEYQRLGVNLGLLVNPQQRQVEIYRLGQVKELLEAPSSVKFTDVVPGLSLNFSEIWSREMAVADYPDELQLVKEQERREMIVRMLGRKIDDLSVQNRARVEALDGDQLQKLGDVLLDFVNQQDLENWLAESDR